VTSFRSRSFPPGDSDLRVGTHMFPIGDENDHAGVAVVTIGLIVANGLAFLNEINRPEDAGQAFIFAWGVVPREFSVGTDLPPLIPFPYWSTLVTSMF